jgi:hypothetical protein
MENRNNIKGAKKKIKKKHKTKSNVAINKKAKNSE